MTKFTKSITKFIASVVVIAALLIIALTGLTIANFKIPSIFDTSVGIRKGLDLVGGSYITYEAQADPSMSASDLTKNMDIVVSMLRERLNGLGLYEAQVTKIGDKRVMVEIPSVDNPEEALQKLGSTAQLQFMDYQGNVILTGKDVKAASAEYGKTNSSSSASVYYVKLTFSTEAAKTFAAQTERISKLGSGNNYIAIVMDNQAISVPSVSQRIDSETCIIEGNFTADSSKWLANMISSGQLPFALKDVELRSVGPVLGEQALQTSLWAGLLGVILVMIFMMVIYRIPGLMADVALIFYIAITGIILAFFRFNLSLPSIAGVILSIGIAVDANVVIFERLKEELRFGKGLKSAVDHAFKRAFPAIIDSHITTIIAALVLWKFGTGPIQGFAITLFAGAVLSLFSAIVVTRFLIRNLIGFNVTNTKLYGI